MEFLTCPKCRAPMRSYERSGVTVDQCTECRGLFLDRGELERLADAEAAWHGQPVPQRRREERFDDHRGDYRGDDRYRRPHKRKSFFEELFD